jgi:hypothetical protein
MMPMFPSHDLSETVQKCRPQFRQTQPFKSPDALLRKACIPYRFYRTW